MTNLLSTLLAERDWLLADGILIIPTGSVICIRNLSTQGLTSF
mgnify:CR=1 FL=1